MKKLQFLNQSNYNNDLKYLIEKSTLLQGKIASQINRKIEKINRLEDIEFSVSSQWGEDGIIDWIIEQNIDIPLSFIEFGVSNYIESNTRFLLQNRNWKGLVIDGSEKNIETVQADHINWKHNLKSISAFITRNNINEIIKSSGIFGEVGILSVDIDGNDYWVWESITVLNPQIVIAEYNSAFGDLFPITVPYKEDFVRNKAHYSNLYYGSSISALTHLAEKKGYTLLGTNSAGSNAFYVRNDLFHKYKDKIKDSSPAPSRFRESRSENGKLTFISDLERTNIIKHLPVANVLNGEITNLSSFGQVYSENWLKLLS